MHPDPSFFSLHSPKLPQVHWPLGFLFKKRAGLHETQDKTRYGKTRQNMEAGQDGALVGK